MQYNSFINIQDGIASLANVSFYNVMVKKGSYAILNTDATSYSASFSYVLGTVALVNNGYELTSTQGLGGFMSLSQIITVTLSQITFAYNIQSNTQNYFISLASIINLVFTNCVFQYNYSPTSLVYIDQTSLSENSDYSYHNSTNIYIYTVNFYNNTAADLINIQYNSECQNAVFDTNTIAYNLVTNSLFTIEYASAPSSSCISGGVFHPQGQPGTNIYLNPMYVNITNSIVKYNSGSNYFVFTNFANTYTSNLQLLNNCVFYNSTIVTINALKANSGVYLTKSLSSTQQSSNNPLLSFDSIQNLTLTALLIENNSGCTLLSVNAQSSLTFNSSVFSNNSVSGGSPTFVTVNTNCDYSITDLTFENLTGPGSAKVFSASASGNNAALSLSSLYFENAPTALSVSSIKTLSISNLTVLSSNSNSIAALDYTQSSSSSVTITASTFTGNANPCLSLGSGSTGGNAQVTITSSTFSGNSGNSALIAIDMMLSTVHVNSISNCYFLNNNAEIFAISASGGDMTFTSLNFTNNDIGGNSLIEVTGSNSLAISNSVFVSNKAGVLISISTSNTSVGVSTSSCTFYNNNGRIIGASSSYYSDSASNFTGNTYNEGVLMLASLNSRASFTNSYVFSNKATGSGIIYLTTYSSLNVSGTTFLQNSAGSKGGALFCDQNSSFLVQSSTFTQNKAVQGSAIFIQHSIFPVSQLISSNLTLNSASSSATIYLLESNLTFSSCTFANNMAASQPNILALYYSGLQISNCFFYNHSAEHAHLSVQFYSTCSVNSTLFANSYSTEVGSVLAVLTSEFDCTNCVFSNAVALDGTALYFQNS
jgi:predicted outer membrane repeat protein